MTVYSHSAPPSDRSTTSSVAFCSLLSSASALVSSLTSLQPSGTLPSAAFSGAAVIVNGVAEAAPASRSFALAGVFTVVPAVPPVHGSSPDAASMSACEQVTAATLGYPLTVTFSLAINAQPLAVSASRTLVPTAGVLNESIRQVAPSAFTWVAFHS